MQIRLSVRIKVNYVPICDRCTPNTLDFHIELSIKYKIIDITNILVLVIA